MPFQPLIDACFDERFADAARMASSNSMSASNAGNPWLALELNVVASFANLRQHDLATSKEQFERAIIELGRLERLVPESPITPRPEFVQVSEQVAVLAFCLGDCALGERLFAQAGEEIDRLFRAYSIADLVRNAYHRALALFRVGRSTDAAAHAELASQIASRVLGRYENHPEPKAIHALRRVVDARDARSLPFWFFVGSVPFATHIQ